MVTGTGVLLAAALGGYLVLERSQKQKGSVRFAGRLVGWTAILLGLGGALCHAKMAACGDGMYPQGPHRHGGPAGWQCPFSSKHPDLPPMPAPEQ